MAVDQQKAESWDEDYQLSDAIDLAPGNFEVVQPVEYQEVDWEEEQEEDVHEDVQKKEDWEEEEEQKEEEEQEEEEVEEKDEQEEEEDDDITAGVLEA